MTDTNEMKIYAKNPSRYLILTGSEKMCQHLVLTPTPQHVNTSTHDIQTFQLLQVLLVEVIMAFMQYFPNNPLSSGNTSTRQSIQSNPIQSM